MTTDIIEKNGVFWVRLNDEEMIEAAVSGVYRQVCNCIKKRKAGQNHDPSKVPGWQFHIEGKLGERALEKLLGIYSPGGREFRGSDVCGYEVRTRSRHDYELIVYKEAVDDAPYVLMTGYNGVYCARGWIYGREAKQDKFWKDPAGGRPNYFVPQSALCKIETLPPPSSIELLLQITSNHSVRSEGSDGDILKK